jgi:hypothetical protein
MADKVQIKLEELSNKRTAKVKKIKDLRDKLNKANTDAEAKSINLEIKSLTSERVKIETEYNNLSKLKTTAKEYSVLNQKLKDLNDSLTSAEARGEDTASIKKNINNTTSRLGVIAPEVERNFPELKTIARTTAATKPASSPDAARLGLTSPTASADIAAATLTKPKVTGGSIGDNAGGSTGGKVVPSTFNVGTFRQADETSMSKANGVTPPPATGVKSSLDTLLAKTDFWYDLPDYIFKLEPKLGELLVQAVAEGWDNEKFLAKAKLTPWWQKNASTIRTRIVDRAKYDELKAAGEDVSKSDYGLYLSKQMRSVKAKAKEIAGVTLTDEQAQSVAGKIYDGFLDDDPLAINALIVPFIGKVTSIVGTGTGTTGFSGQALQNYQTLQGIAKANGFTLKDILPNVSALTAGGDMETAVLRGLADGSLDINRISQDARMLAAQGQPQYVRGLLSQGYDLQDIYAPYRNTMATTLELDPNAIDLNDPTLRAAITDKGDMNMYDYKKTLRQDNRWQYTGSAKQEVSNAALSVLRDFGFQG